MKTGMVRKYNLEGKFQVLMVIFKYVQDLKGGLDCVVIDKTKLVILAMG
jgi:hypothetical protein